MIEFILFAFLVNVDSPIGYRHLGWYTGSEVSECRSVAKQINDKLPHVKGRIGTEWALCRCFHCGDGWP